MLRFARDVGINVLANIVAAAIIYLLGVWAGAFPNVGELVAAASAVVVVGVALLTTALHVVAHVREIPQIRMIAVLISASVLAVVGLESAFNDFVEGDFLWAVISGVSGIALVPISVIMARQLFRFNRVTSVVLRQLSRQIDREMVATPDEWSPNPRAYL